MSDPRFSSNFSRLMEAVSAITGDHVHLLPADAEVTAEHSWDVRSTTGALHGMLTVETSSAMAPARKHLYNSLSEVIADMSELHHTNRQLEERFRQAGLQQEELAQANRRLREAAFEDTITGTYRRSYLQEQLQLEIARAQRYERPFALLLTDVDHFKTINDTWGHAAGDTALRHLSTLMTQSSRTSDVVSRFGGDEFCLLLTDTDLEGATEVSNRILRRCGSSPVRWGEITFQISVSIGVAAFEHDRMTESLSPQNLLDHVDKALYQAKRDGRGRAAIAPPMITESVA